MLSIPEINPPSELPIVAQHINKENIKNPLGRTVGRNIIINNLYKLALSVVSKQNFLTWHVIKTKCIIQRHQQTISNQPTIHWPTVQSTARSLNRGGNTIINLLAIWPTCYHVAAEPAILMWHPSQPAKAKAEWQRYCNFNRKNHKTQQTCTIMWLNVENSVMRFHCVVWDEDFRREKRKRGYPN